MALPEEGKVDSPEEVDDTLPEETPEEDVPAEEPVPDEEFMNGDEAEEDDTVDNKEQDE